MSKKMIYKSAKGKEIDMLKLIKQNEMTIAVGNAKVNARGDKLGPGGQIIKRREEIIAEGAGGPILNQVNVRPAPEVVETPAVVTPVASKKDIKNQDPEGNE
jgi:hypothetical protein